MKKIYLKPDMETVLLNTENTLLAGSDGSNAQADAGGIVGTGDNGPNYGSFVPGAINGGGNNQTQDGSEGPIEEDW